MLTRYNEPFNLGLILPHSNTPTLTIVYRNSSLLDYIFRNLNWTSEPTRRRLSHGMIHTE